MDVLLHWVRVKRASVVPRGLMRIDLGLAIPVVLPAWPGQTSLGSNIKTGTSGPQSFWITAFYNCS